jgi:SAM-dependent methyltransferase
MPISDFSRDYYEDGVSRGISFYENYRWMPDKTIPAVMAYIDYLKIPRRARVLDFGCAKGFYVKAFRMLQRDAWGCDVSEYAIRNCDCTIQEYVNICTYKDCIPFHMEFDYIIAKDVLEHLEEEVLLNLLNRAATTKAHTFFISVPLAKDGKYIVESAELDITHKLRWDINTWEKVLTNNNLWYLENFSYDVDGLKSYQTQYTNGVGFFILRSLCNKKGCV